ncbi:phosphatidylglycerol lysyltransferase [Enterococcus florum]|uniref:Phosphatidylglycerol lysyltransferase n=1 Tax=Enterococcus florum TaxID=2480627 RepID=A0A4P5PEF3_9ENTE|nr:lysylphosphatidylglycerol synthase transmembrane domain-containing protein [Enterococcus florum]GCF94528.1 phosphatidylglycerol lysyltransferase [Enterococcus florum]
MKFSVNRKLVLNILFFIVILGLIIFVVRDSLSEIFSELASTSGPLLLGVTFFGLISQLIEGYTIKNIAAEYNPEFSIMDGFFASAYATFYRVVTFGTGSIVAEVIFYRKKGLKVSQGTGVTALRMVIYKIAVMIWALVFLFIKSDVLQAEIPNGITLVLIGIGVSLTIVAVLLLFSLNLQAQVLLVIVTNRLFKTKKLRDLVDKANLQFYSLRETIQTFLRNKRVVLTVFLSNMAKLAVWYLIPYFILSQEYSHIDLLLTVALISFTVTLGGVLPAPGGIGGFEFVYVLLFQELIGRVEAISSMLLYRYATYLLPFLIGMVYVLVNKQREIRTEIKDVRKEK